MAKSRAQRKAEAARRRQLGIESDSEAQHDTQVPESAEVLEAEIAMEQGAADAGRITDAPAPSRADVGRPGDSTADNANRRERRRLEKEKAERAKAQLERRSAKPAVAEKERSAIPAFFSSVTKELAKVQWPDRDTLVQASAVTLLFVAIAAAYLGALDAVFSKLVDLLIT
ncbi:MAG: preprotein translocase subunit SecE [Solirubrobacterales bacterium]|nr:preprotein translocase subunit SecE [Solirubrobacterales bacterium]